jgi:septal ring factor EnvC (AmiA/AmiB activator)
MKGQRKILKGLRTRYREKLETLKDHSGELELRLAESKLDPEAVSEHRMKLENDVKYYEQQIEHITERLKALRKGSGSGEGEEDEDKDEAAD